MILIVSTCSHVMSEEEFVRPIAEIVRECGYNYDIRRYYEKIDFKDYSKVIICGTAIRDFAYLNSIDSFRDLTEFEGGVLGICAGYQIIARIYSNELERIKKIGVYSVRILKDCPIVKKGEIRAYFLHAYALKSVKRNLEVIAVQNDEICIFKVKKRDFYGVSFHPEVLNREIIVNFLNL